MEKTKSGTGPMERDERMTDWREGGEMLSIIFVICSGLKGEKGSSERWRIPINQ